MIKADVMNRMVRMDVMSVIWIRFGVEEVEKMRFVVPAIHHTV